MARTTSSATTSRTLRIALGLALLSAFSFGSSGAMARALIDTGWTAGAAVLVRLGGTAVLLTLVLVISRRGRVRISLSSLRILVLYGVVAMAGTQFAFFNAVRTLDVGVAILLEFTAPVLLLGWTAARSRRWPRPWTLTGAALALLGLACVIEVWHTTAVDLGGVVWGLAAAVCLAAFFVISARQEADLPPLVMAAGGTAVGAAVIGLTGAIGVVPLGFATRDTLLAGVAVGWWVPALWLVAVSTGIAYLTGIAAIHRLGTRSASFVALTEVLFAALVAWALLAQLPGAWQLVGGALIVSGIVLVQRDEAVNPDETTTAVEGAHPV